MEYDRCMKRWLYLIRHGETDWNMKHKLMGSSDEPLNTNGIQGADKLGKHLSSIPLTILLTSPLQRAQETAAHIALQQKHHCRIQIEPLLRERSFGALEGKTYTEIVAQYPRMAFLQTSLYPYQTPGGSERLYEVQERARQVWNALYERDDPHIGIVTHGAFGRVLLSYATGIPLMSLAHIEIRNTSLSVLSMENTTSVLHLTNYVPDA